MAGQKLNGYEITHIFRSCKEEGTRDFAVVFVVERDVKQYVLDFKAVVQRIFVLRIKS